MAFPQRSLLVPVEQPMARRTVIFCQYPEPEWLRGTHHGVSHQHLQAYLNEFTFRFNRRFYPFNAFRSLLGYAGDITQKCNWHQTPHSIRRTSRMGLNAGRYTCRGMTRAIQRID
jgi:hypothetical protein